MSRNKTTRSGWIALAFLVVAAGLAVADGPRREAAPESDPPPPRSETPTAPGDGPSTSESTRAATSGLRGLLDPDTGLLRTRPTGEPGAPRIPGDRPGPSHWLNTYSADLVEEALPQGGYMVDLRGRFQSALTAKIDAASGETEIDCRIGPAPEANDEE